MSSNPTIGRTSYITARASTAERMRAEKLQHSLGLDNQSELMRTLIEMKAAEMGVS